MSLGSLITFAHEHICHHELMGDYESPIPSSPRDQHPRDDNSGEATIDDEPLGDRPHHPGWLSEPAGDVIRVEKLGNLVIDDEETLMSAITANQRTGKLPIFPEPTGADTLAFYLPFHFYTRKRWGIYLRALGIAYLAYKIKGAFLGRADTALLRIAEALLFDHESYHCTTEAAATRAEVVTRDPVYRPYFYDRRAAPHEEAMANADAYRRLQRTSPAHATAVEGWMSKQGVGYRDFGRYVTSRDFARGRAKCGAQIIRNVPPKRILPPRSPVDFLFGKIRSKSIPIYMVVEQEIASHVLRPFPKFNGMAVRVHSREHPPPHIHIEIPPGNQITKYVWDEPLHPVKGQPALSSKDEKRLIEYLHEFGNAIHKDVSRKYAEHSLRMPAFLAAVPIA